MKKSRAERRAHREQMEREVYDCLVQAVVETDTWQETSEHFVRTRHPQRFNVNNLDHFRMYRATLRKLSGKLNEIRAAVGQAEQGTRDDND